MLVMQVTILVFVAIAGTGVVLTRDPASQSIAVSFYGLLLALLFFIYQAPDVALSQIVTGAVALPLMIMLALAKIRRTTEDQQREKERTGKARRAERPVKREKEAA
ncbi:MAG: Na(+)/H(+) antiporter subunit B [Terriglobales bacterium]